MQRREDRPSYHNGLAGPGTRRVVIGVDIVCAVPAQARLGISTFGRMTTRFKRERRAEGPGNGVRRDSQTTRMRHLQRFETRGQRNEDGEVSVDTHSEKCKRKDASGELDEES